MESTPTTCKTCGRAMWTKDVDANGNCPDHEDTPMRRADRNPSPAQVVTPVPGAGTNNSK